MVTLIIGQDLWQLVRSWRTIHRADRLLVRKALSLELLTRRLVVALTHLRLFLYDDLTAGGHTCERLRFKVMLTSQVSCLALHQ